MILPLTYNQIQLQYFRITSSIGELKRRATMLGEFYKGYYIVAIGTYVQETDRWSPRGSYR